jgi:hypothetical protein
LPLQIAAEVILLWVKQMFFALAIDGLGTFICECSTHLPHAGSWTIVMHVYQPPVTRNPFQVLALDTLTLGYALCCSMNLQS